MEQSDAISGARCKLLVASSHASRPATEGRASKSPMRLSGGPARFHTAPAPLLGQHNRDLLTELGLTADEIAELENDGIIGQAPAARGSRKASR